jgi:hypothetical protein
MYRFLLIAAMAGLVASCNQATSKGAEDSQATVKDEIIAVTVEELIATPADYKGKEVAISGMVTHVCRHGGQKCFIVGEDGESQIRIEPSGDIDEFKIDLEGSNVAFKGTFKVLTPLQAEAHVEDHDSKEHHDHEMAHTEAEKADIFIEAVDFKVEEITQ